MVEHSVPNSDEQKISKSNQGTVQEPEFNFSEKAVAERKQRLQGSIADAVFADEKNKFKKVEPSQELVQLREQLRGIRKQGTASEVLQVVEQIIRLDTQRLIQEVTNSGESGNPAVDHVLFSQLSTLKGNLDFLKARDPALSTDRELALSADDVVLKQRIIRNLFADIDTWSPGIAEKIWTDEAFERSRSILENELKISRS